MSMLARTITSEVVASKEGFLMNKGEFELELLFQPGFSFEEFQQAAMIAQNARSEYGYVKAKIIFKEPSRVYFRNKYKSMKELSTLFFIGSDSQELCFSEKGRSGHFVQWSMDWRKAEKIILIHPDRPDKKEEVKLDQEKQFKRICNARFDAATWSDLKLENFREKRGFYYIKKVFDSWDMERIQKAFENKEKLHITKDETWRMKKNQGRHYTVEGNMGEDGIYRAWFCSEYAGCANGDYYLLLNPQLAVFRDKD